MSSSKSCPSANSRNTSADSLGAHTKELYSMAGLVFLADFFGLDRPRGRRSLHLPLRRPVRLEPRTRRRGLCTRTLERYQQALPRERPRRTRLRRGHRPKLIEALDLDVSRQRLDSTHVFSHMASFGRTKLMAVAIKRFLTQLKRHDSDAYAALPEDLRRTLRAGAGAALRRRQGRRRPRTLPSASRRRPPLRDQSLRRSTRPQRNDRLIRL